MRTFVTRFLRRITFVALVFCGLAWRADAASFTWDASPDAAAGKVAGYKFYYSLSSFISLPPDVAINPAFKIVTVTNGTSVTISDLLDGLTYFMTVTAFDANGQESAPSNILTYTAGQLPPPLAVAITDPTAAVNVSSTSIVTITATATGPAAITKVEFFDGSTLLATKTAAPYTFSQTFAAGVHFITAKATDVNNATATSAPVTITSTAAIPLTVSITDPVAASINVSPTSTVTVTATATGPAAIAKVEFFDGSTLLTTKTAAPYSLSQTFAAGVHIITAKATDVNNTTATSTPVTITSTAAVPLTVAITNPVGSIDVSSTSTVTVTATAAGPAAITKVEFFDADSLLTTTTAAPYTFSQTFTPGFHFITAKATDANNTTATSDVVIITSTAPPPPQNLPPVVSLVGLTNGALLSQPVVLNASASDPDGTVASVEFIANSSSLGVIAAPPYTVSPRLISGTYALKVKATDNLGAVTFSSIITVSVKPPPPVDLTIK
jgi:hypothetical protein